MLSFSGLKYVGPGQFFIDVMCMCKKLYFTTIDIKIAIFHNYISQQIKALNNLNLYH